MRAQELSPTARAAEHFVKNQKDAVTAADLANAFKVRRRRDHATSSETADGFNGKRQYGIRIQFPDFFLKCFEYELGITLQCMGLRQAIGQRGRYLMARHAKAVEEGAERIISRHAKGRYRPTMVGGQAGNEMPSLRCACRNGILTDKLDGDFHGFAAAAR